MKYKYQNSIINKSIKTLKSKLIKPSFSYVVLKPLKKILNKFGLKIIRKDKFNSNNFYTQELRKDNIRNLKVLINREELLKYMPKNGIVAELGVDQGNFSKLITFVNKPKKLYLIDSWRLERYNQQKMKFVEKIFNIEIGSKKIKIIREDSVRALNKFNNNYFDWIYIDTSHTYEQTKKELEISNLKIKSDGIISGHDYAQGNVNKALEYGVIRAVNEFCVKHNWEIIYLTLESDGFSSFALKKMNKNYE